MVRKTSQEKLEVLDQPERTTWIDRYATTGIPQMIEAIGTTEDEIRVDQRTNFQHCIDVFKIIMNHTNVHVFPGFEAGVNMHDLLFQRVGRSEKKEQHTKGLIFGQLTYDILLQLLNYYYDNANPDGPNTDLEVRMEEILYGMGIAISSQQWEIGAESGRDLVFKHLQRRLAIENNEDITQLGSEEEDLSFLDQHINAISQHVHQEPTVLINDVLKALRSGTADVTPAMRLYRAPVLDIYKLLTETATGFDLEGLVIKAAEVVDNLLPEHRNTHRPASAWRDAQELLSFYAPMLEFLGFNQLASLAYGTAYEYFNQDEDGNDSPNLSLARGLHDTAVNLWSHDRRSAVLTGLRMRGSKVFEERVKHPGSIVDKIEQGRGSPDIIGLRVLIPEPNIGDEDKHIHKYIQSAIDTMELNGFILGDNRGGENPPVEIRWAKYNKGSGKRDRPKPKGYKGKKQPAYEFSTDAPSVDRYEGIHLLFYDKDHPEIGIEVQMFTPRQNEIRTGIAAHAFYKARTGVGKLGEARRAYEESVRTPQDRDDNSLNNRLIRKHYLEIRNELVGLLGVFKERINRFAGDPSEFKYWTNIYSINTLLSIPEFAVLFNDHVVLMERIGYVCPDFWKSEDEP